MSKTFFSLDVRRARKGDCLLLHYGTSEAPGLVIIDGGPSDVYQPFLRTRLTEIREARGLSETTSLPVDLLMISHIDDDHIKGILELTQELVTASDLQDPLLVKLKNVWHNTFDDIIGNDPDKLRSSITAVFGAAALDGEIEVEGLDEHGAKVLASVPQGRNLRDNVNKLAGNPGGPTLNKEFKGKVIQTKNGSSIDMKKGLRFTVAGPMKAELAALQKEHDKFLAKKKKATPAALAAYTDKSVPNLSSIVVLAEVGTKKILLTGDARGDKILEGLEKIKLIKAGGKMHVDILKVPHHGSDRNMKTDFFRRVTADHYIFSGNGEHGNPERETLQMLLDARGEAAKLTIHLTYPINEIDAGRKAETQKKGKPWSPKKDSLKSFLQDHPGFAKKVSIVDEEEPHVIDLFDKINF